MGCRCVERAEHIKQLRQRLAEGDMQGARDAAGRFGGTVQADARDALSAARSAIAARVRG